MPTDAPATPVQMLIAYSQQRATANDVMRALTIHKDWLAPALLFAQGGEQHLVFEHLVLFDAETRLPPGELWIFTDTAAALRAQTAGALLGPYATHIAGTELFTKFLPTLNIVRVNPYSPQEQTWQFLTGSFEHAALWAQAIALEESFKSTANLDVAAISRFQGFLLFNHSSGYVITLPNQGSMKNPAAVFTAPDCADSFWAKLSEAQRTGLNRIAADGLTLIKKLPLQQIDGIFFNAFGPGLASVLSFAEIEDVNALYEES
jgi:hypothetical protein